jgi:nicotinamide mononucleotide adenylyltransferase
MRGVYPGSFNPPTIGHLAIIEAAIAQHALASLDLVVSRRALVKGIVERPTLADRVAVLRESVARYDIVGVVVTDLQLIADIADDYDLVVMGADKWRQVNNVAFYESTFHRGECLARLPRLAIAARGDDPVPDEARLNLPDHIGEVSSSGARSGALEWMTPAARRFAGHRGGWGEPA